jgi:hypothetical protein
MHKSTQKTRKLKNAAADVVITDSELSIARSIETNVIMVPSWQYRQDVSLQGLQDSYHRRYDPRAFAMIAC